MTTPATSQPVCPDLLHAEAREYQRMTTLLQTLRGQFTEHGHAAVDGLCGDLVNLAAALHRRAQERRGAAQLKPAPAGADKEGDRADPAVEEAFCDLMQAQHQARVELMVTLEIARDLELHARTLRTNLMGPPGATYDARGQAR